MFIFGGNPMWDAAVGEVYSPNGECNYQLARLSTSVQFNFMNVYGNDVIFCGGIFIHLE